MNTVKKDRLKIFSILAGIMLLVGAVVCCAGIVCNVIAVTIFSEGQILRVLSSQIINSAGAVCFAAPAIVAAIILFVKKNSAALFIALGLLTCNFFSTAFNFVSNFILGFVSVFAGSAMLSNISSVASIASLVLGFVCAVIVAVVFFIPAATFIKKRRFILAFIMALLFAVGAVEMVIALALSIFGAFNMIRFYGNTMIYDYIVWPIIYTLPRALVFIPVLLAAIGMIGACPKSCAACEQDEAEAESERINKIN